MRKLRPYFLAVIAMAVVYNAWIFYARWDSAREARRNAAQHEAEADRKVVEAYGGDRLTILTFYASPGYIRRGQSATLCYGVSNAKAVRIEPAVKEVWPSLNRCLEVSPAKTTNFELVAEDGRGTTKKATALVEVQ